MPQREDWTLLVAGILMLLVGGLLITLQPTLISPPSADGAAMEPRLLTDPFLQYPTENAVRVVWFTEFPGQDHHVRYGAPGIDLAIAAPDQVPVAVATTTLLNRTREDASSKLLHPDFQALDQPMRRPIWRHEAIVSGLSPGQRYPYQVSSTREDGIVITSRAFTLAASPPPGQPLKLLLTSDHQLMPMTPANLQKVQETIGRVDGVLVAGDLVNIPDRASEWFDDARGNAFFPSLQGQAHYALTKNGRTTVYRGGELIQHAPLFPAIGNHEIMGRYASTTDLNSQFNDPVPRAVALGLYRAQAQVFNPQNDPGLQQQWILNNSFNHDTYSQIFSLPSNPVPTATTAPPYYAISFGDMRLISLYVTQIWRSPKIDVQVRGRYQEREQDLGNPYAWGYGQLIFEAIDPSSQQYQWLLQELASEAFQSAKYKVVMFHHPPHSLGENIVPAFTPPVPVYDRWPDGSLKAIRYEYPLADDQIMESLVPLLEPAGVQLVLYGHSHLWNRFLSPQGTHYLETSNVGNTYGAYWDDQHRPLPPNHESPLFQGYQAEFYRPSGDPNGLTPIVPTLAPLIDDSGQELPYLASNDITAFSILDTATGQVSSYYFDTRQPDSAVVKFDEFSL